MLILAAVSIATLTGENGILTQANKAKIETRGASVEEAKDLWKINQEADSEVGSITAQTLEELLNDLESQNLITAEERKNIEEKGKVTIGSRTIIFKGVDYSKLTVGDYVNYPVYYDNVGTTNNGTGNIPKDEYNGWRILSIDTTNETVRLVSAGVPLNYTHASNKTKSVENLTIKFFSTPITSSSVTNDNFSNCGFKTTENGTMITDINALKSLYTNRFTAVYGDDEKYLDDGETYTYIKGNPKVQAITKDDLSLILGNAARPGTDVWHIDLLAVPCKDNASEYAPYWLGSRRRCKCCVLCRCFWTSGIYRWYIWGSSRSFSRI